MKDDMVSADPERRGEISRFCYNQYFLQIHDKIAAILETNLHLLEGESIPESFSQYYRHVASERVFFNLLENNPNVACKPTPYPEDFYHDIMSGFSAALKRQELILFHLDKDALKDLREATIKSSMR